MARVIEPPPVSERSYHKGNVAEDLRKAAEQILRTERLEDVTVRRLAREVEVTPANFYNHFRSVEHLVLDIAAAAFDEMTARAAAIWAGPGGKVDLLMASAIDFVRFGLREKELLRVMFGRYGGAGHVAFDAAANRSFGQLVRYIYDDDRYTAGARAQHESCGIAYGFFALCYGLARTLASEQFNLDISDTKTLERFVELSVRPFLDGSVVAALAVKSAGSPPRRRSAPKKAIAGR